MPNRSERDGAPYSPPKPGKLAARHTLIAEFMMGYGMMAIGVSGQTGGDGTGMLHRMLEQMGLDNTWGYYFIAVGYLMLQNAGIEFLIGRRWSDDAIQLMAGFRRMTALCAVFGWLIIGYLLATTPLSTFKGLMWQAPVNLGICAYFFFEASRVHYFVGTFLNASRSR